MNPIVARCWKCGRWLRQDDEYKAESGFYTCADCQGG